MKIYVYLATFAGASGVGLGAFGAHGLKDALVTRGTAQAWETAVLYQLVHAVAILGVSLSTASGSPRSLGVAWSARTCALWAAGIFLFSGSLYSLALGGPGWIGPVTPLGGVALMLGWVFLGIGVFKNQSATDK